MIVAKENKKTKYKMVLSHMREQIEKKYKLGDLIPPEKELAKVLGVNKATVALAMNTLKNEGYVQRKPRLGTVVCYNRNQIVKSIITGVLYPYLQYQVSTFTPILNSITQQAVSEGYANSVVNIGCDRDHIDFNRLNWLASQQNIAGIIICGIRLYDLEKIREFSRTNSVPVVVTGLFDEDPHLATVSVDNHESVTKLLKLAKSKGYEKIAYIGKNPDSYDRKCRYEAFVSLKSEENVFGIENNSVLQAGYKGMKKIILSKRQIDCVFAADFGNIQGIKKAIAEYSPESNFPIICFDDNFEDNRNNIIASAIQPFEEIGTSAAAYITSGKYPEVFHEVLENKIVEVN